VRSLRDVLPSKAPFLDDWNAPALLGEILSLETLEERATALAGHLTLARESKRSGRAHLDRLERNM